MKPGETTVQARSRVQVFLTAYDACGSISNAAEAAGITVDAHYKRLKRDEKYRAAFAVLESERTERRRRQAADRAAALGDASIALKENRVRALESRWQTLQTGLQTILRERAEDMKTIPGGQSGMLTRDYRGKDSNAEIYRIDPGIISLIMEIRNHERQAAQELGQLVNRTEMMGPDGTPLFPKIEIVLVDSPLAIPE